MRVLDPKKGRTNGGNGGKILEMSVGSLTTPHGVVMQVTAPLQIAMDFLRERISDPFWQLIAVGFNPAEMVFMEGDALPVAQVTFTTDQMTDPLPQSERHGVVLPHKSFRYMPLVSAMREEMHVIGGAEGMQHRECIGIVARGLAKAVFDEKGAVRGSNGIANALPLYAPAGPWALYVWQGDRSVVLPTRFEAHGSRLMAVGRDVIVNAQIGRPDFYFTTRKEIKAALASSGRPFAWRSGQKLQHPLTDLAVEWKSGTLPVLQVHTGEGEYQRFTFEAFREGALDAVKNDGPTPRGAIIHRLPEEIVAAAISSLAPANSERCIRRSVAGCAESVATL